MFSRKGAEKDRPSDFARGVWGAFVALSQKSENMFFLCVSARKGISRNSSY